MPPSNNPPPPPPPPPPQGPDDRTTGILTAGFFGVVLLVLALSLLYFLRSKAHKKRIEENGTIFHIKDVIRGPELDETNFSSKGVPLFSRVGINSSIIMPEKSITRKPHSCSPKAVVLSRRKTPLALSTLSFQRPLSQAFPHPRPLSNLNPSSRHSRSSSGFSTYTQNHPSGRIHLSPASSTFPMQPKPVHQLFEPSLPDELSLTRYGEGLMVLQSFDDGWCLVARDMSRSPRASRFSMRNSDKVDIGLVPAWVFVEPIQGNTTTRPFRSASINALPPAQISADPRNAVISWSYFG